MAQCCPPDLVDQCRFFLEDEFFKAFVDESRLNIILLLMEHGEMTVNTIASRVAINQSNVSRHLALLYRAGVAKKRKDGREIHYQLDFENMGHRLKSILNIVYQCCPPETQEINK